MTLHDLMDYLNQVGIAIGVDDKGLWCEPRSAVTTQIEAEIRTHKAGLIANLRPDPDPNKPEIQKAVERLGFVPVDDGVGWDDGVEPVPCDKCGGIDNWLNVHGEARCTKCDPRMSPEQWLKKVERARRLNPAPERENITVEEKVRRKSLCSPIQKREDPPGCPRCRSTDYIDIEVHDGQSLRRDCAQCQLAYGFSRWQGEDRP